MPSPSRTSFNFSSSSFDTFNAYPRRWWILAMLSICALQQSNNWTTFSVIYETTHNVYGWDKFTVDLLTAYAQICFIVTAPLLPFITTRISYRKLITASSLLICASLISRSITIYNPDATILAHIAQILNGIAGPLVVSTSTSVSSTWFPSHQRTFATSIAISSSYAGCLVSYLTSLFIKAHDDHLLFFLKFEAILAIIISMIICMDQIFFEDEPQEPPSLTQFLKHRLAVVLDSQSTTTYDSYKEVYYALGNINFHFYAFIVGIYQGLIVGWTGILDVILGSNNLGYSQRFVGTVGIIIFATFMFAAMVIGFINDSLKRMAFKPFIVILTLLSGIFLLIFVLITDYGCIRYDTTKNNTELMFALICCMLGIFCNAGTYGLTFEEACNLLYPCREIIAGTILTMYVNVISCGFIIINSGLDAKSVNFIVW
eukprot:317564_1